MAAAWKGYNQQTLELCMLADMPISNSYRGPLRTAVGLSVLFAVLSALMLDGGQAARLSAIGLLIFWSSVMMAIWRRPQTPTPLDLLLVRWGCVPLVLGFQVAIYIVWHLRGLE